MSVPIQFSIGRWGDTQKPTLSDHVFTLNNELIQLRGKVKAQEKNYVT